MKTALMVAEKPSLAASLANILSNGRCSTRKGELIQIKLFSLFHTSFFLWVLFLGLNGSCSVHEWVGQFKSETVNYKMTSVCGHVMTLDFIGKYNNWDKVDPVKLDILHFFILVIVHLTITKYFLMLSGRIILMSNWEKRSGT